MVRCCPPPQDILLKWAPNSKSTNYTSPLNDSKWEHSPHPIYENCPFPISFSTFWLQKQKQQAVLVVVVYTPNHSLYLRVYPLLFLQSSGGKRWGIEHPSTKIRTSQRTLLLLQPHEFRNFASASISTVLNSADTAVAPTLTLALANYSRRKTSPEQPYSASSAYTILLHLFYPLSLLFIFFHSVICSSFWLLKAEMKFKDKWLACVTLGEQTFRTAISDQLSLICLLYLILVFRFQFKSSFCYIDLPYNISCY